MVMQGRTTDPTGANPEGIWASPERDIAHCGPTLIRVALQAMEQDMQDPRVEAEMGEYAKCLSEFVTLSTGPDRPKGEDAKTEVFKQSGLLNQSGGAHRLFGKWLARVFLGQYFDGVGEALHPGSGERALGVDELVADVKALGE
jgi:hypothetical protein